MGPQGGRKATGAQRPPRRPKGTPAPQPPIQPARGRHAVHQQAQMEPQGGGRRPGPSARPGARRAPRPLNPLFSQRGGEITSEQSLTPLCVLLVPPLLPPLQIQPRGPGSQGSQDSAPGPKAQDPSVAQRRGPPSGEVRLRGRARQDGRRRVSHRHGRRAPIWPPGVSKHSWGTRESRPAPQDLRRVPPATGFTEA